MTHDPLAALELDGAVPCASSRRDSPWIVPLEDRRLLLPQALVELLRLHRAGLDAQAIGGRLGADPGEVTAAIARARAGVTAILARPAATGGHLVRRDLVGAPTVARLARPLVSLFRARLGAVLSVVAFGLVAASIAVRPSVTVDAATFWGGYTLCFATLFVHELGHAAACLAGGVPPGPIGATIYLVFPAFYADVSAAWALSRARRVAVDIGGVYVQLLATAMLAVGALAIGSEVLQAGVLFSVGTLLMTSNPVLKMDGYWLVSDALGVPNLGSQVGARLRDLVDRARGCAPRHTPWPPWVAFALSAYALASAVFLGVFAAYVVPWLARCVWRLPAIASEVWESPSVLVGPRLFELLMTVYGAVLAIVLARRLGRALVRRITAV